MKVGGIVQRAKDFAAQAHEGQERKYTGVPYIIHPIEVMGIVMTVECDDAMLAAALLHDVVEDTDVTIGEVEAEFGADVASLVSDLTDISNPEDGNRKLRKALDREHSAKSSARAQTVKLADLISNSWDIMKHDPAFAKLYMQEKLLLLGVLTRGNKTLLAKALRIVADYYESR